MKSVCFFASYFKGNDLPYYIIVYLKELKKHFKEVVLLTSQKNLSSSSLELLNSENIQMQYEENKGFDFGLWYKAFQKFDVNAYDRIALVNDSCILFKSLDEFMDWSAKEGADLQGITASATISPHIQSYFMILNKKAIALTKEYFNKHKIKDTIGDVIKMYEIGLSWHLVSHGLSISAFIDNDGYEGEFSPYYRCVNYHISKGIPVIKKKILFSSYRKKELFTLARMNFNISPDYYIQKIKDANPNTIIDLERLKLDFGQEMNLFSRIRYWILCKFIILFRPFYKLVNRIK